MTTDAAGNYYATFNDGESESGIYTYTPSGDNAVLVLTPSSPATSSHINLAFASSVAGTYTADTLVGGSFTLSK